MLIFGSSVLGFIPMAVADPTCTTEPESQWIDFEQAKSQVEDMGYEIKVFKRTDTGCYELYGYNQDKQRVEIYFDPTNLAKVKEEIDD
nr:PepSY domain-containing protein [Vibrio galatheae]